MNHCLLQHLEKMCLGHGSPSISSLPFMYLRSFFIAVLKLSRRKASFRYQSHSSSSFCTLSFFWKMFGEGTLSETRKKYQQAARSISTPKHAHHAIQDAFTSYRCKWLLMRSGDTHCCYCGLQGTPIFGESQVNLELREKQARPLSLQRCA